MAKKVTKKKVTKKKAVKKTATNKRYSFVDDIHARVLDITEVAKNGTVKIKRIDLKRVLEEAFEEAAVRSAGGERIRFPIIGTLVRKEVKPLKAGKYLDPFSGEEKMRKARPASKKPRWSFPKKVKEIFATKKYW